MGLVLDQPFVSKLVAAPKLVRKPSDYLLERSYLMRRYGDPPSIKDLEGHALRFGTLHVVETAVELGHSFEACVRLQDACTRIRASGDRKFKTGCHTSVGTSEARVKLLMGIEDEDAQ